MSAVATVSVPVSLVKPQRLYRVSLRHDAGTVHIVVSDYSRDGAARRVCRDERAPFRAVRGVREVKRRR